MFSSLSSVLSLLHALFLRGPFGTVCMCITRRFLDISVQLQRYLRFSHALNILIQEKVGVGIRYFRVSVTITVTVSTTVLPFTESRAHKNFENVIKAYCIVHKSIFIDAHKNF